MSTKRLVMPLIAEAIEETVNKLNQNEGDDGHIGYLCGYLDAMEQCRDWLNGIRVKVVRTEYTGDNHEK